MLKKWKKYTLDDLGKVVGGGTPSTKNKSYYGGGIPWITPKDLSGFEGRFINYGERSITEEGLNKSSAILLPPKTILFSSRAPIGYIAIAETTVSTNQGFKSIIPNEKIDYMFLYYLLKHNKENISNLGTGSTFREVSGKIMRSVEVLIPESLEEQKKIASVLNSIDEKIENNRQVNHHLVI